MKNGLRFFAFVCLSLQAFTPARAQHQPAAGSQQFVSLGDFKLQSGAVVRDFHLGYRTLGKLNGDKSNAILWPTWLGGVSEDLLGLVGSGKVVDDSKYFVILVDAIGNGVSSSPSNSKVQPWMRFPEFTIRDMVEAERRLVLEVLQISHLRAAMGVSMGGMQTFEWAVAYPDFIDLAISMAGSPQSTSYDKLLWSCEIDAVELDPAWNNGHPTGPLTRGLQLYEEIDSMNLYSPAYRVAQTPSRDFGSFQAEIKKKAGGDGGAASDFIRQRQAIMSLDIPSEFGGSIEKAAQRVHAKLLVIISPQDHMVNATPALKFADAISAPVITLDSACGHASFWCISVGPVVTQFIADPTSVHSATLHDSGH
jgi:homoserine O-acetyltransferase/O-succinyltransferase